MGSYSVDNTTATQGRYADIVATSQSVPVKPKISTGNKVEKSSFPNEVALPKNDAVSEEKSSTWAEEQKAKKEEFANDEEKLNAITETLNEFMSQWNAHLQFSIHKETSLLTVKFVDQKSNKVLKEFPPEEYLDMIGKIREFIGSMVDEKV